MQLRLASLFGLSVSILGGVLPNPTRPWTNEGDPSCSRPRFGLMCFSQTHTCLACELVVDTSCQICLSDSEELAQS